MIWFGWFCFVVFLRFVEDVVVVIVLVIGFFFGSLYWCCCVVVLNVVNVGCVLGGVRCFFLGIDSVFCY